MTQDQKQGDRPDPKSRAEAKIEANLKRVYDETAREALPAKLADLLSKLKAEDAKNGQ